MLAGLTGCALLGMGLDAQPAQPPAPAAAAGAQATSSTDGPTTTTDQGSTSTTGQDPTTTTDKPTTSTTAHHQSTTTTEKPTTTTTRLTATTRPATVATRPAPTTTTRPMAAVVVPTTPTTRAAAGPPPGPRNPVPATSRPPAGDSIADTVKRLTADPLSTVAPAPSPPAVGPEVLEGFSEVPGDVALPAGSEPVPPHHPRAGRPPVPEAALPAATGARSGGRRPSPWALAGLTPVAVLMASAAYSAWWRRRVVPA